MSAKPVERTQLSRPPISHLIVFTQPQYSKLIWPTSIGPIQNWLTSPIRHTLVNKGQVDANYLLSNTVSIRWIFASYFTRKKTQFICFNQLCHITSLVFTKRHTTCILASFVNTVLSDAAGHAYILENTHRITQCFEISSVWPTANFVFRITQPLCT